tara:strand:- start:251 stop:670 length:420 start_codon:yes stop_codon:yes gene_type:complete
MATTTATIALSTSDMMDSSIAISNTATLTNAGTDTGMTKTTGLSRVTTSATSNVVIFDSGTSSNIGVETINKGKFFMQNLNDRGDGTKYVTVLQGAVEIGRLYGGDWMFCPWQGGTGNDLEITPSSTTDTILEYILFYE